MSRPALHPIALALAVAIGLPLQTGCTVLNGYPEVDREDEKVTESADPPDDPWVTSFGGDGEDVASAVAVTPDDGIVMAGSFESTVDFGLGPMQSYGGQDAFLVGLDRSGHVAWNAAWGGTQNDLVDGLTVLDDGDVVVAFGFSGLADLGGEVLEGLPLGFGLVRYRADGEIIWARGLSGFESRTWGALTSTPDGGLVLTGILGGRVDFGLGEVSSIGQSDVFVLRMDGQGNTLWCNHFASSQTTDPDLGSYLRPHAAPDGSIYLAGYVGAGLDLGEVQIAPDRTVAFIAKLDPDGELAWARTKDSSSQLKVYKDVTVLDDGSAVAVGAYIGTSVGGTMTPGGLMLSRFDANGISIGERRFDAEPLSGWPVYPVSIESDDDGNLTVLGSISADLTIGEATLKAVGGFDTFVARLSDRLEPSDAQRFGDGYDENPWASAVNSRGSVIVAGGFEGQLRVDQQSLISAGNVDAFLAKLVW
jgi:hypothetical protein